MSQNRQNLNPSLKMNMIEDDVKYHHCDVSGCDFKTKNKSYIKQHKARRHTVSNVQNPNNNLSRKRSIDCLLEEEDETENANEEQTEDANEEQTGEQEYDEVRVYEDGFIITTCKRRRVFL